VPFVLCEAGVIFRVDNGELAPGQWNSPEGIAVANSPIHQHEKYRQLGDAVCYFEDAADNCSAPSNKRDRLPFRPHNWLNLLI